MTVFSITAAANTIQLDSKGQGHGSFTVSNSSGRPLRARAEVRATDPAQQGWLNIAGDAEREFATGGTHQFAVGVTAPPGSAIGTYSFRLDVVSVENPDDEFAEGPSVSFEVAQSKAKAKAFPWWVVAVAALVVIAGVSAWLLLSGKAPDKMPSLVGLNLDDANKQISGLKVSVKKEFTGKQKSGTVLEQNPPSNQALTEGQTVELVVEENVEVPLVVGSGADDAKKAIEAVGLKFASSNPAKSTLGQIVSQSPTANTRVPPGQAVTVAAKVVVPRVVGAPSGTAQALLAQSGLVPMIVGQRAAQVVIRQSPTAGTEVPLGTPIALTLN